MESTDFDTPAPSAPRQTHGYLRNLFQERGLHPKNKLGQNFLIDLNLIDFLVRHADLDRSDLVLEIGTGTGSLTARLLALAGAVLSLEIDPSFFALAQETLGSHEHLTLLNVDVLENKNRLQPVVVETLAGLKEKYQLQQLKLVANLPYAVATPVISNLLLTDLTIERMVVTVQLEIAERLIAAPGTKPYGALAVLVQSLADVEILRRLPPTVFWPRPQVSSAIVRIFPRAAKRAAIPDVLRFRVFLRDLYAHRRKNLRGALASMPGRKSKTEVDALLAGLGIEGGVRAEELDRETHLRLCVAFG